MEEKLGYNLRKWVGELYDARRNVTLDSIGLEKRGAMADAAAELTYCLALLQPTSSASCKFNMLYELNNPLPQ
ncbi:hypothetical protein L484_003857 [Morus notabilis]|uniref:Uncharacterized protein n=1 Tax=Morus notabilis TaxID=981085 RepID=W9RDS8_9ROSA|nr:hypothetical protein L484_003857 [Morus notabilis]